MQRILFTCDLCHEEGVAARDHVFLEKNPPPKSLVEKLKIEINFSVSAKKKSGGVLNRKCDICPLCQKELASFLSGLSK